MSGFGRQVGPEGPPSLQQRFGNFSRPSFPPPPQPTAAAPSSPVTSLPFPRPTPSRSPRVPESIERPRGHPFVYQSSGLAASPDQSIGIARRPEAALSAKSSPYVPKNFRPITRPQSFGGTHRIEPSQEKVNAQKPFPRDDFLSTSKPAAVTSFVASRGSNASLTEKFSRFQEPRRYKAPPSQPANADSSGYSIQTSVEYSSPPSFLVNNGRHLGPPRPKSPPLAFEGRDSLENAHPSTFGGQRSGYSSPVGGKLSKFPGNASTSMARQSQPFGVPHLASYDPGRSLGNEVEDMQHLKRTRFPSMVASPVDSQGYNHFAQVEPERSSIPPPTLGTRSIVHYNDLDSLIPQRSLTSISNTPAESTSNRISSFPVTKRTRVSTLPSADEAPEEDLYSVEDDADREIQAKAKRLARFKKELSENFENVSDMAEQKFSAPKHEQDVFQRRKKIADDQSMEVEGNFNNVNTSSDLDAVETSSIITGLCRDMCPESERAERERKGDLDQYERFEGDRNQTNKFLAVKKYTRTAEREASLIRPMEILQKTIDYLLRLLDQPYDDRFLGLYNFLWDRMRAIRMDLRMQHIFNQQAITMLEQMIRLHIAAMHELCEYTKGEGFSEGFDAHLNIEQMNKTSVELFQVYDDHRKKGLAVSTEKEFRGYYALLKLDKHPGYKVEPAELSLDLAKMTPDIRQTPEVLFARAVARACRTGNFIAFFRLARKATYLQACLMHAHFAKLRTQALASLHAGLQNNQGLPIAHVAKWLAMEDEDIESLLEYHGFLIKDFREPYMVKEGPFINADNDYPTKCSKLVHMKKSKTIVADVSPSSDASSLPAEIAKEVKLPDAHKCTTKTSAALPDRKRPVQEIDQEMSDSQAVSSPKVASRMPSMIMKTVSHKMNEGYKPDHEVFATPIHNVGFSFPGSFEETQPANNESVQKPTYNALSTTFLENKMLPSTREISPRNVTRSSSMENSPSGKYRALQERSLRDKYAAPLERAPSGKHAAPLEKSQSGKHAASSDMLPSSEGMGSKDKLVSVTFGYTMESPISNMQVVDNSKDEELGKDDEEHDSEIAVENYDEEVAEAKLKLIIRLWKRRTSKLKELRELRQVAACAALNSLSLGPPIRQPRNELSTANEFDIDILMMKRHEKYVSSWSRLNVSEVIADVLSRRNPDAKCICWKIILCSSMNAQNKERLAQRQVYDVGSWLFSKLMPCNRDDTEGDLLVSSPGMSIWKRWIADQDGNSLSCCLSVVKDVSSDNFGETESGTSAILFIVNPSSPWNLQKNKLHTLLELIPSGSSLPLLILGGSSNWGVSDASATITTELGLHEIDKSKVRSFSIVFLVEDQEAEQEDGFFSDTRLREGLSWLASEAPPQPYIQSTKTRELVLARLNPSLDVLETMTDQDVGPNHCISVFNEALDWSLREINASAKENPIGWPCPEIGFLDDSCDEYMLVKWYLPSTGWSSAGKMGPLLHAVGDCKLPSFPNILSWLHKGANSGDETLHLRSQLENCLITYLSQSSEMMGLPLAEKEANVMIQRCARLEILDSTFYIIPSWIKIFRRIFNWRLTRLSSGMHSTAYVHRIDPTQAIPDEFGLQSEFCLQSNVRLPYLYHPSLDEVIGLNTALDTSTKEERRQRQQQQEVSSQPADVKIQEDTSMCDVAEDRNQNDTSSATENFNIVATRWNAPSSTEMLVARKAPDDKLSKLLDECEKLQDNLDKKLYVYF